MFTGFLSGNALKLLAALFMTLDHAGLMLFPRVLLLRILGRLAMPIFAFMIAEGCKYTRNRKKYFGMVFGLGVICQAVYYFAMGDTYLSILITFSLSILTVFALQHARTKPGLPSFLLLAAAVAGVWWLNRKLTIDYGFWGCMLPVFIALVHKTKYDRLPVQLALMGIGLVLMAIDLSGIQYFSLGVLPILLCYSGKRGKWNLKYFFYIFYPLHLVVLEGIAMMF